MHGKLHVADLDTFFHMDSGVEINFPVEDIIYLGDGFLISCQIPQSDVYGIVEDMVLCFRICDDDGFILRELKLPQFDPDAYVNFYLYEKRLLVTIDDYVLVYKYNADNLTDPNFEKPIEFQILDDIPGQKRIMVRKLEVTSASIVNFFGGWQMFKKKTLNFWKE